jgi:hypothetical protein
VWENCFFSISKDKTVGLYSVANMNCKHIFGVHSSFISRVKWQVEQDYLLVECEDGSVSIWEMETGQLEECLIGEKAKEIMDASADVVPQLTHGVTRNSVTGLQLNLGGPPLQMAYLNIKNIIRDLYKNAKSRAAPSTGPPVHLAAYKAFCMLLPWRIDPQLDELMQRELATAPPTPTVSFALHG